MDWLKGNWEDVLKDAAKKKCSYQRLLEEIIGNEYELRWERAGRQGLRGPKYQRYL